VREASGKDPKTFPTPLHFATQMGCGVSVIKQLLDENVTNINLPNREHLTPLALAIMFAETEVVDLIIQRGAEVKEWPRGANKMIARCCFDGDLDMIKFLISKGIPMEHPNGSALCGACYIGNKGLAKLLIDNGANLEHPATHPLFAAIFCGYTPIVELLLSRGADPNFTPYGITPLTLAKLMQNEEVIRLLEGAGAKETPPILLLPKCLPKLAEMWKGRTGMNKRILDFTKELVERNNSTTAQPPNSLSPSSTLVTIQSLQPSPFPSSTTHYTQEETTVQEELN